MIINGSISSAKTSILIDKYATLLNSGIDASKILVLVQNSNLKNNFVNKCLEKLSIDCFEKLQVYSFSSLVYNSIIDNWAFIENKNPYPNPKIIPNLAGLEVSQFILKKILKKIPFKGYNSKKSLLHQLFRRYSLIVQNNLSDDEIKLRTNILKESFAEDAEYTLKKFLKETLSLRDFDYLRQILVFKHIYQNTNYFKNIEYLILDDGDEITPVCFDFINYIRPQLKDFWIAFDEKGGSRIGYLSADKTAIWEFEKLFNEPVTTFETRNKLKYDAENIYQNIIEDKQKLLENFSYQSPSRRSQMINLVTLKIKELLNNKIKPNEISIVTPIIDDVLKFGLNEQLNRQANLLYLSGNEKLIQNKLVLSTITILKLNTNLKNKLTEFDIRPILTDLLKIPFKYCEEILVEFDKTKTLLPYKFEDENYNKNYHKLLEVIDNILPSNEKLTEQVFEIYSRLISFTEQDEKLVTKFNFFIKQLQDFENIFGKNFISHKEEIILQIENSIIAENPYSTLEIYENDIVVCTPQKLIDNQIKTKYQFWLDISNNNWIKSDSGPMYNAWVFQKGWTKDEYTIEDEINLSKEKTAKTLRKLTLCATEKIFTYSSLFDGNGVENFGGIEEYIHVKQEALNEEVNKPQVFKITPRPDQLPVLQYTKGHMAISAVPGAGKTTILLALIIKLLDSGISPDNIFVMTYMESAARNFRDRIKSIRTNSSQLPYISTIHGLALRILKENNNLERLGLSADFDICDDTQKNKIIKEAIQKMKLSKEEIEEFTKGISTFKIGEGNFENLNKSNQSIIKFKLFYQRYQSILRENNLIDYDDILINSVKLLEENEDIRDYYQNICGYIIEDEAQDSSSIQQKLINILSDKHKNLIRCGDINQAITTTFSNADVKGFRKFIENGNKVSMNCSQRCTKDVWQLANKLVSWAETIPTTKEAFYNIMMNPVEGKNPVEENAVRTQIFDKQFEEQNFILKEIKNAIKKNPKITVGILLRYNSQVNYWASFINNSGLKSITRSECLEQKAIFRVIFSILKIVQNPFDNENLAYCYSTLAETGLYSQKYSEEIRNFSHPFITISPDVLNNTYLEQFLWDVNYWLGFSHLTADELAIKIGLYYFNGEIEISNVYLISTLIKRISNDTKNLETIINRLEELAKRNSLSGFKFFSEEDENNREFFEGKVQLMTLHKSKGDEFDYVFMPEMTERNLPINISKVKLRQTNLAETIKALNPQYTPKTEFEQKQEIVEENLRLLYVAITRAKKRLYLTVSKKYKYKAEHNKIFDIVNEEDYANILT